MQVRKRSLVLPIMQVPVLLGGKIYPPVLICLFIVLSIYLSISLSIYLAIYPSIHLSVYLSVYISICLFIYTSIYLSVESIHLPVFKDRLTGLIGWPWSRRLYAWRLLFLALCGVREFASHLMGLGFRV